MATEFSREPKARSFGPRAGDGAYDSNQGREAILAFTITPVETGGAVFEPHLHGRELVKLTGIDRSTLADLVARLLAQGYLQRKRTKDDGRTNAIRITTVGKKMLKMAQPGADEVDKQLLSLIPSSERKSFIDNLSVLAAEMDRIEEKEPAKPVRKLKTRKRA